MKFDELGLSPEVMKAVNEMGYTELTPIQEQTFGLIRAGRDLLAILRQPYDWHPGMDLAGPDPAGGGYATIGVITQCRNQHLERGIEIPRGGGDVMQDRFE